MTTITDPSEAFVLAMIQDMDIDNMVKIVNDDTDKDPENLIENCVKYGVACGLQRGFEHFKPRIVQSETDVSASLVMLDEISQNLTGHEPYFERLIELRNRLITRHNETWAGFNEGLLTALSGMLGISNHEEDSCTCLGCSFRKTATMTGSVVHKLWLAAVIDNPDPDLSTLRDTAKAFDQEKDGKRIEAFLAQHDLDSLLAKYTPWAQKQRTEIAAKINAALGKYAHPTSPEVVETVNRVLKESFGGDQFRFTAI